VIECVRGLDSYNFIRDGLLDYQHRSTMRAGLPHCGGSVFLCEERDGHDNEIILYKKYAPSFLASKYVQRLIYRRRRGSGMRR